jgi:hypothetical protein
VLICRSPMPGFDLPWRANQPGDCASGNSPNDMADLAADANALRQGKPLPLSATLTVHGTNLGRGIVYTVPRDLLQNTSLSRQIRIRSRTNTDIRMREQISRFCFRVRLLREPDAVSGGIILLGLNLDRRNQHSDSKA